TDAGHGLTLLVRADGSWERLSSRNLHVGLLPDTEWGSFETQLEQGDMIVSFSDGVLDLYDGTLSAVDEVARLSVAATSAQEVVDAIQLKAQGSGNPDDVTIIAVRRDRRAGGSARAPLPDAPEGDDRDVVSPAVDRRQGALSGHERRARP
ncbi:MAG: SpoIIE family protein phosphatase, partial [Arthrobacter oryzae]